VTKVDPATGPVKVKLERQRLEQLGPQHKLVGQVVGPDGQPREGAKVDFESCRFSDGGGMGGAVEGIDPLAVSGPNGEFVLASSKALKSMTVTVETRGMARRRFKDLPCGPRQELRLTKGTVVSGRLVREGQPTRRAVVGLVGTDRSISESIGTFEAITDDQGRFAFPNIPPGKACFVYSLMSEAKANGGVSPVKQFIAGRDETTTDLGDVAILPAFRLAGRVGLADGQPLAAGAHAILGREDAWDSLPGTELSPTGSFAFEGVPAESVSLVIRVPGYRFSAKNPSLDRLNGQNLVGQVSGNLEDLTILLEPGEFRYDPNRTFGPDDQPRNKPLRGVPPDMLPPSGTR
jgi:hypothetical protein